MPLPFFAYAALSIRSFTLWSMDISSIGCGIVEIAARIFSHELPFPDMELYNSAPTNTGSTSGASQSSVTVVPSGSTSA